MDKTIIVAAIVLLLVWYFMPQYRRFQDRTPNGSVQLNTGPGSPLSVTNRRGQIKINYPYIYNGVPVFVRHKTTGGYITVDSQTGAVKAGPMSGATLLVLQRQESGECTLGTADGKWKGFVEASNGGLRMAGADEKIAAPTYALIPVDDLFLDFFFRYGSGENYYKGVSVSQPTPVPIDFNIEIPWGPRRPIEKMSLLYTEYNEMDPAQQWQLIMAQKIKN